MANAERHARAGNPPPNPIPDQAANGTSRDLTGSSPLSGFTEKPNKKISKAVESGDYEKLKTELQDADKRVSDAIDP